MFYKVFRVLGRKFLALFNLRIVKIPLTEQMLNILLKKKNIKFLQIGANDGISFDCLYDYVTKYQWEGVCVEPLEYFYQLLCNNYQNYPKVLPIKCAIHPNQKELDLYKLNPSYFDYYPTWAKGIASISENHLIKHGVNKKHILLEKVKCMHLVELIISLQLENIDYLQIDTEGFDAEIIQMIDFSITKPMLIKYEIKHIKEEKRKEIEILLKNNGYKLKSDFSDCFAINKF